MWVRVLHPFGYYVDHQAGETLNIPLHHVGELVEKGLAEIVVNNLGNNLPYNEIEVDPLEEVINFATRTIPIESEEE